MAAFHTRLTVGCPPRSTKKLQGLAITKIFAINNIQIV